MGNGNIKNEFIVCERCGKKLIERKFNGIFHFIFGKPGEGNVVAPVEMFIQGNIKIKCLRRSCGHWQVLSYLPNIFQSEENLKQDCGKEIKNLGG
jgi:hypothetical protein